MRHAPAIENGEIFMRFKTRIITTGVFAFCLSLAAGLANAHHSASQFDFSQNVPVTGVIKELDVSNPHIYLILAYEDDGVEKEVEFEGHSRNNVYRRGWRPGMMEEGDTVTIFIAPMRNGEDGGYIQSWETKDGTTF